MTLEEFATQFSGSPLDIAQMAQKVIENINRHESGMAQNLYVAAISVQQGNYMFGKLLLEAGVELGQA